MINILLGFAFILIIGSLKELFKVFKEILEEKQVKFKAIILDCLE